MVEKFVDLMATPTKHSSAARTVIDDGLAGSVEEARDNRRSGFGGHNGNSEEALVSPWTSGSLGLGVLSGGGRGGHGGLAGNALVCIVVWKNTQMRTVTNLFIVNLSTADLLALWRHLANTATMRAVAAVTADLLVVLVCLPPTVVGDITETWFVGRAFCKLIHYLQVGTSTPRVRTF